MAIDANKVYHVMNGNATTRRMNLYSSGSVSNGMNVVLYDNDDSNEQKWYFDGQRFFPESGTGSSYHKYCLDRYTASTYLDNADMWEATAADAAAQVVEVIKYGYYQRVRLKTKITNADGEKVYYYLTAGANTNGTGSGKTAGAAGNIYWAEEITTASQMMRQNWIFTEVGTSSSGDDNSGDTEDNNDDYDYEINGVGLPLEAYPKESYWTNDGKATDASGSNSIVLSDGSKQCAGFAKYVYKILWGSYYAGHAVPTEITLSGVKSDFDSIGLGARINCRGDGPENHSMILLDKDDYGVTIYDANWDNKCGVDIRTYSYSDFANTMWRIKTTSYTP